MIYSFDCHQKIHKALYPTPDKTTTAFFGICKAFKAVNGNNHIFYGTSTQNANLLLFFSTVKQKLTTTDLYKYFCFDTLIIHVNR